MDGTLDARRIQEFARRLFGHYTSGMLTLMIDIGHRSGLFEAMAVGGGTSEEIAARAGLHARYVREWLAAMATGGVVDYDAASQTFSLPGEHAVCLTGSSSRNLAGTSQALAMLAGRLVRVSECFKSGGGVPYSQFRPDLTDYFDASSRLFYDELLIKVLLPAVQGLPERLTAGIRVADFGCGTGHAINLMARQYPASDFVGYDIAADAIGRARAEAAAMDLPNARFEVRDVTDLPAGTAFDLVTTFDAVHDQRDPAAVLRSAAGALGQDGAYLVVEPRASSNLEDDIGSPFAPWMYGMSVLHCLTVSLAENGAGLGAAWGEQAACQWLAAAGFTSIQVIQLPGPQNTLFACRR